jgi:acetoin:2,6-dichlorophenolindophenol oxidoreductase subunit alpha
MLLSVEKLLDAYRLMRTIRDFEETVNKEFMEGNIPGFVHLYAGQEASAVGICLELDDKDKICSTHRGHGHCIAKRCDVKGMMAEIFGKSEGLCSGKGGSMHIADLDRGMLGANAIVGGAPPLTIGAGLSAKVKNSGGVAVSFTGDGGASQGTTFEAINMAVVLQLPVIFVFENNGYGEGTGHDFAVGSKDIAKRAEGFGLPAVKVDGYDFFAVHAAMQEAISRARNGQGPSVIETHCMRFYGHFVGDPENYRPEDERKLLQDNHDCLNVFRASVLESKQLEVGRLDELDIEIAEMIADAVVAAKNGKSPELAALHEDVYLSY